VKDGDAEELWADLKEIQASMAIEGYELSEEQLLQAFNRAQLPDSPRNIIKALKEQALDTGEDLGELIDKYLDYLDAEESENQ